MCSRYRKPRVSAEELHAAIAEIERRIASDDDGEDVWPGGQGLILSNAEGGLWTPASFGLMPHWAQPTLFRSTYNARSESVAEKPSFRSAWKKRQFCLIPVLGFFEPCYETGKAVPWLIRRADGKVFTLAGIWESRGAEQGGRTWSFSMLTINADPHPLMSRFHKPTDEKRSIVVIPASERAAWLQARSETDARALLKPFDEGEYVGVAHP